MADYTREQLEAALRKADAAGDEAAARAITAHLSQTPAPNTPNVDAVRQQFEALPWYGKLGTAAADTARLASDGLTFGFLDQLRPMITGRSLEEERAMTEEARIRAGSAGTAAEIGGMAAPAMLLPNMAPAAAARVPAVLGAPGRAIASGGIAGLEGMAFGGLDALGHGEDVGRGQVTGALGGIVGSIAANLLARGGNAIGRLFDGGDQRMQVGDLRAAKDRAYKQMEDAGVEFNPDAIDDLIGRLEGVTDDTWPIRHPQAIGTMSEVKGVLSPEATIPPPRTTTPPVETPLGIVPDDLPPPSARVRQPITLDEVDKTRQAISKNLASHADRVEADYGADMINEIDRWLGDIDTSSVTARSGTPDEAVNSLLEGRQLNSRMRKLEQLEGSVAAAERRAARNLQSGEDATLRANIDSILGSPKRSRGFSPDELAQMDEVVRGTPAQNRLRQAGRLAPGGGLGFGGVGAGAAVGTVLTGGSPVGGAIGAAIPPAVGYLSKKASERSTRKSIEELLGTVAGGGRRAMPPPRVDKAAQDQLRRMLMMLGIQQND